MTREGKRSLVGERFKEKSEDRYGIVIHDYDERFDCFVVQFIEWNSQVPVFSKSEGLALESMACNEAAKFFQLPEA
jgi:hypothetical protein